MKTDTTRAQARELIALPEQRKHNGPLGQMKRKPSVDAASHNGHPKKLKAKKYDKKLRNLQGELCRLQEWVKYKRMRVIIIFEGRDAAGKGGTIRALTERVSPRVFRVVALPAPSD